MVDAGAVSLESFHVSRWSEDKFSMGSWSQLLVNGSPKDREQLASPLSSSLILAGEACDVDMPAMVNGAFCSGKHAAEWALSGILNETERMTTVTPKKFTVIVIGAGAAGIAAARHIGSRSAASAGLVDNIEVEVEVVVLEARNRIGGRAFTVDLGKGDGASHLFPCGLDGDDDAIAREEIAAGGDGAEQWRKDGTVRVDAGAMYLQQVHHHLAITLLLFHCASIHYASSHYLAPLQFSDPLYCTINIVLVAVFG
jgi:hypothetical protein